jgi:outer membrane protein OmpU
MKKLGLTALAGSLVASSAFAGDLSVTGSSKVVYAAQDDTEVTGNPFSMSTGITFAGSGDLEGGGTMSYSYTMSNAAFSGSSIKLDMGDTGELAFGNAQSVAGIKKYSDNVPTAGEQVYDDVDGDDNGIASTVSNTNMLGYNGTFGGIGISLGWAKDAAAPGSDSSWVVTYDGLADGLDIGFGMGDNGNTDDTHTGWLKYTYENITAAYQRSEVNFVAAGTNTEKSDHFGISVALNENLTLSAGRQQVDMGAGKTDEESTGFAASYTMGSLTLAGHANKTDDVAGSAGVEDSVKEVSVAFAF